MAKITEIEELIKEKLNIKEINKSATLTDYGLDSLDVVEFILELEERFNITFSPSETKDLKSVGDLLALIEKKLA